MCVCVYPLPFGIPYYSGHHSALRRVLCAIQYVLISIDFTHYLLYLVKDVRNIRSLKISKLLEPRYMGRQSHTPSLRL